jgi:hypothetical protein
MSAYFVGIGPAVALSVYEYRRWRSETGRRGWLAMRFDHGYWRAARRSGRVYLGLLAGLWFLFCSIIFGSLLDAL